MKRVNAILRHEPEHVQARGHHVRRPAGGCQNGESDEAAAMQRPVLPLVPVSRIHARPQAAPICGNAQKVRDLDH